MLLVALLVRGTSKAGTGELDLVNTTGQPGCDVDDPMSERQTEGIPVSADLHHVVGETLIANRADAGSRSRIAGASSK